MNSFFTLRLLLLRKFFLKGPFLSLHKWHVYTKTFLPIPLKKFPIKACFIHGRATCYQESSSVTNGNIFLIIGQATSKKEVTFFKTWQTLNCLNKQESKNNDDFHQLISECESLVHFLIAQDPYEDNLERKSTLFAVWLQQDTADY